MKLFSTSAFELLFLLVVTVGVIVTTSVEMQEQEQTSFSFSRVPNNGEFVCNDTNANVSQHYSLTFNNTQLLARQSGKQQHSNRMTRLVLDFSDFSAFTVSNVTSNNLNCMLFSQHLMCKGKNNIKEFVVNYTLSLPCNNHCSVLNDSRTVLLTTVKLRQNSLVFVTSETDTLKCKCIPPTPPPSNECTACKITKVLRDIKAGEKLVIQSEINAYSFDGSCCNIFNSSEHQVGEQCKNFPQHWTVHKSERREDIGELKFTFPTSGDFTLRCCSDETRFEQGNVLGPMMGPLNFYITNKNNRNSFGKQQEQELSSVWECPMVPPSNITSTDQVYGNCNNCSCFVQDMATTQTLSLCENALNVVHSFHYCNFSSCDINALCGQNFSHCNLTTTTELNFASLYIVIKQLYNNSPKTHKRISLSLDASTRFVSPCLLDDNKHNSSQTCLFQYQPFATVGDYWIDTPSLNIVSFSNTFDVALSNSPPYYFSDVKMNHKNNENNSSLVLLPFITTKYYSVAPAAYHTPLWIFNRPVLLDTYQLTLTSLACNVAFEKPFNFTITSTGVSLAIIVFNISTTDLLALNSSSHNYHCTCKYMGKQNNTCTCVLNPSCTVAKSVNFTVFVTSKSPDIPYVVITAVGTGQLLNAAATSNTIVCDQSFSYLRMLPTNASFQTNIDISHKQVDTLMNSEYSNCTSPITTSVIINQDGSYLENIGPCYTSSILKSIRCVITDNSNGRLLVYFQEQFTFPGYFIDICNGSTQFQGDNVPATCSLDPPLQNSATVTCCSDSIVNWYPSIQFGLDCNSVLTLQDGTNCDPTRFTTLPVNVIIGVNANYSLRFPAVFDNSNNKINEQATVWCAVWTGDKSNILARFLIPKKNPMGYVQCQGGSTQAQKVGSTWACNNLLLVKDQPVSVSCCSNVPKSGIFSVNKPNPFQILLLRPINDPFQPFTVQPIDVSF